MSGTFYERALEAQRRDNWREALEMLRQGVANSETLCMWWLGWCHREEIWGLRNKGNAQLWYQGTQLWYQGMDLGCKRCAASLLVYAGERKFYDMLPDKHDDFADSIVLIHLRDEPFAFANLKELVKKEQCPFVQYYLGILYIGFKKQKKALYWFLQSAQQGFALAQRRVALHFYAQKNDEQYIFWLRKVAAQLESASHYDLAKALVPINAAASLYWLRKLFLHFADIHYLDNLGRGLYARHYITLFRGIERCEESLLTMLCIRWSKGTSLLHWLPKDVVKIIGKHLWKTREEECWEIGGGAAAQQRRAFPKRIKVAPTPLRGVGEVRPK